MIVPACDSWLSALQNKRQAPARKSPPLSRRGRHAHAYEPNVSVKFVDFAVGWFLGDPPTWARLHHLYDPLGLPIPPPRGNVAEWKTIFDCVYAKYRARLARLRPVRHDEDRATSHSLSYMALRRCAASEGTRRWPTSTGPAGTPTRGTRAIRAEGTRTPPRDETGRQAGPRGR